MAGRGVVAFQKQGKSIFKRTKTPNQLELAILVHTISHRVVRYLERQSILERDEENSYLHLESINNPK